MSAKAFSDIMIAAGFGEEPAAAASHAQHRAHSATASFEAQLAEQQRAYERLRSIQGELKADEDQVAAEVAKLRRRLEEAARGLSAAESRRERLRRELGQTETEINELAKQKAHFTSEIHAPTERAAAANGSKRTTRATMPSLSWAKCASCLAGRRENSTMMCHYMTCASAHEFGPES